MQNLLIILACILPTSYSDCWSKKNASTILKTVIVPSNRRQTVPAVLPQKITVNDSLPLHFWQLLHHELRWPIPNHPLIKQQKQRYLNDHYHFHLVTQRAQPYLAWITIQIKQRQLPMELVLLPMVESAFNPHAHSAKGAAGLWQITQQTGQHYGVPSNAWYDGRWDIVQATETALTLLTDLNRRFNGDWLLTLAAYNGGATRISQAIKERKRQAPQEKINFWSLKLPPETKMHVIKLLALSSILRHPQQHGISLPTLDPLQSLVYLDVGQPFTLSQISSLTDLPLTCLKAFNPGYRQATTGPTGPYHPLLPQNRINRFKKALARTKGRQQLLIADIIKST